jgi:hypothetical protein
VSGEKIEATFLEVEWSGKQRTVWLDEDGRVLRLKREDGLEATATRLVRYQ